MVASACGRFTFLFAFWGPCLMDGLLLVVVWRLRVVPWGGKVGSCISWALFEAMAAPDGGGLREPEGLLFRVELSDLGGEFLYSFIFRAPSGTTAAEILARGLEAFHDSLRPLRIVGGSASFQMMRAHCLETDQRFFPLPHDPMTTPSIIFGQARFDGEPLSP